MGDYEWVPQVVMVVLMLWGAMALDAARWRWRKDHPEQDRYR
jgi:hypothetical protein